MNRPSEKARDGKHPATLDAFRTPLARALVAGCRQACDLMAAVCGTLVFAAIWRPFKSLKISQECNDYSLALPIIY